MFHEDVLPTCLPLLFDIIRELVRFCRVNTMIWSEGSYKTFLKTY